MAPLLKNLRHNPLALTFVFDSTNRCIKMNEKLKNHPLNGIGLDALLGDLVREYGWDILAEQLPISCFKNYPSFKSSVKFLKRTEWARERLEDLYLYKFLQYPLPQGEQTDLPPRNRIIEEPRASDSAATIELGEPEFFATPSARSNTGSAGSSRRRPQRNVDQGSSSEETENTRSSNSHSPVKADGTPDPWAKWRK